ncbi:phosphate/phosphite/phosphonate ABC transporter substrate-binding protein [Natrarchaeobius sp. A-rgal3]|uniref:phosphate/phosphite/phosphonate ABC transporter substrate-binding protein n=1 Tax=Natrarchaeobius versutus TaxID=1679078 RepID=UPI00351019C3
MSEDELDPLLNRRTYLTGIGATGAFAVMAGCLSDDDGDAGSGGNNGGSGGNGGTSSNGETDSSQGFESFPSYPFDDFDLLAFNELMPQRTDTLIDNNLNYAMETELDALEPRDEPAHGDAPMPIPEDEDEWVEPDTLQISYSAGEDAQAIFTEAFDPILENIEEETGIPAEFAVLDNPAAVVEAMRQGRIHAGTASAGTVPYLVNIGRGRPIATGVQDGLAGYRIFAIADVDDDDMQHLGDFAGKDIAHAHETSNSGHLAPLALFPDAEPHSLVPGEDYEIHFAGDHQSAARGILAGDYDGSPNASSSFGRAVLDGALDGADFRAVYISPMFLSNPTCLYHALAPDIQDGIRRAYLEYDYEGTVWDEMTEFNNFIEFDYATHHHAVLMIHRANDIQYDIEDI